MWRRISVCWVIFWCIIFLPGRVQSEPEQKIVEVLRELNVTSEHYVMHCGERLGLSDKQKVDLFLHSLQKYFQFSSVLRDVEKDGTTYTLAGVFWHFDVKVVLFCENATGMLNPYFSIQVTGYGPFDKKIINIKKHLTHLLRINRLQPHFHFSMQGNRQPSMDQTGFIREVLERLHATEVESMHTQTVSVSAYSPFLGESIPTKGGRMNMQIGTRMNEKTGSMMITVGTPIITIEY